MINALTIDLEDYFMVSAFEPYISKDQWDSFESRVSMNARRILTLLNGFDVRATFFTVGWVAERFPDLVKEISDSGHEIACHGYFHRLVYDQSPLEFRQEVRQAKMLLESISGQSVRGFRAPSFSLTHETPWAWRILEEEGFEYDASVLPARHSRGGMKGAERFPHRRNNLIEFPMSTMSIFGWTVPFSGGGYFRLFPYSLIRRGFRQGLHENRPIVVYLHPWELDPGQPRFRGRRMDVFKHYVNLEKTEGKFLRLLREFRFDTAYNVLKQIQALPVRERPMMDVSLKS